jgi:hypothetical protein
MKDYAITIETTIKKTYLVQAEDETLACDEAWEAWTDKCDPDEENCEGESYNQHIIDIKPLSHGSEV